MEVFPETATPYLLPATLDSYLDYSVGFALEQAVGFVDAVQREAVGNQRRGIDLPLGNQSSPPATSITTSAPP